MWRREITGACTVDQTELTAAFTEVVRQSSVFDGGPVGEGGVGWVTTFFGGRATAASEQLLSHAASALSNAARMAITPTVA
jgi:hypothetical protein